MKFLSVLLRAFFPSPGVLRMAATTCQWQQPPGVMLTAVVRTPASRSTRQAAASYTGALR